MTFGGPADRRPAPTGGRDGVLSALLLARLDIELDGPPGADPSPAAALRFVAAAAKRGGLVVIVSEGLPAALGIGCARWRRSRHGIESWAIEIADPRESDRPMSAT